MNIDRARFGCRKARCATTLDPGAGLPLVQCTRDAGHAGDHQGVKETASTTGGRAPVLTFVDWPRRRYSRKTTDRK